MYAKTLHPATRLFLVGWLTTVLILPALTGPISDTRSRAGIAHWLWTGIPPLTGMAPSTLVLKDRFGNATTWHGIGHSLLLLPADVLLTPLLSDPNHRFIALQYLVFRSSMGYS